MSISHFEICLLDWWKMEGSLKLCSHGAFRTEKAPNLKSHRGSSSTKRILAMFELKSMYELFCSAFQ